MSEIASAKETVKKMQKIVYAIMCDIDDFCKENNITYYLSGGTCLGAVRHQGFIPWDDDGDLMMPRADYERFLKEFQKAFEGKYFVGSLYTDENWQRPSSRICDMRSRLVPINLQEEPMGVFLDVFPIDGLPEGKLRQRFYYRKLRLLNGLRNSSIRTMFVEAEKHRAIKSMASIVTKKIGPRRLAVYMDRYAAKFDFNTSTYVAASLPIHYGSRETIEKKHMAQSTDLRFIDRDFPVPIGYEQYLTNLYGDYMKIPEGAEEKGYTHLSGWRVEFDSEFKEE